MYGLTCRIQLVLLLSILWGRAATEAEDTSASGRTGETLQAIVGEVLERNPSLQAARRKWEAAKQRPEIAEAFPDPILTYGHYFQNVETRVGAMNQRVGLSQKIPFPGKQSLAATQAEKEARLAYWEYRARLADLVERTKRLYYQLYRIEQSEFLLEEEKEVAGSILQSARTRYEAGQVPQQDILKAQLALDRIEDRLLDLAGQREGTEANLNALRVADDSVSVRTGAHLEIASLPAVDRAMETARRYRQELQAAGAAIERDEAALALAKKQRWPDITLGVEYTEINDSLYSTPPDNGRDAVQGIVSINLPLWFGKLNAREEEARHRLAASRSTRDDLANQVTAEVREAWSRARFSREQLELYREQLIPQAEQTLQASEAGYRSGEIELIELLDSERALLNFRLAAVMAETGLASALAGLERTMGVDLQTFQRRKRSTDLEEGESAQ